MATFEEFARSCIMRLKAAEDKRTAADVSLFGIEDKVLRIADMMYKERAQKQQEIDELRQDIEQNLNVVQSVSTKIEAIRVLADKERGAHEHAIKVAQEKYAVMVSIIAAQNAKNAQVGSSFANQQKLQELKDQVEDANTKISRLMQQVSVDQDRYDEKLGLLRGRIRDVENSREASVLLQRLSDARDRNQRAEIRIQQLREELRVVEDQKKADAAAKAAAEAFSVTQPNLNPNPNPIPVTVTQADPTPVYPLTSIGNGNPIRSPLALLRQQQQAAAAAGAPASPSADRPTTPGTPKTGGKKGSRLNFTSLDVYQKELLGSMSGSTSPIPTVSPVPSPVPSPSVPHRDVHSPAPLAGVSEEGEPEDIFTDLISVAKPQPVNKRLSVNLTQQAPISSEEADLRDMIKEQYERARRKVVEESEREKVKVLAQATIVVPGVATFELTFDETDSILLIKKAVQKKLQDMQKWPPEPTAKGFDDYALKTMTDSWFMDEVPLLKYTPYYIHCKGKNPPVNPELHLVDKKKHKHFLKQYGSVLGQATPMLCSTPQANYFRDNMSGVLDDVVSRRQELLTQCWKTRSDFLKAAVNSAISPPSSPATTRPPTMMLGSARASIMLPSGIYACTIRLYLSADMIKTFTAESSTTVAELTDLIYSKYGKMVAMMRSPTGSATSSPLSLGDFRKSYVIKIRGIDEFLIMPTVQLSSSEFIKDRIRRKKKLDLVLVETSSLPSNALDIFMEMYINYTGETGDDKSLDMDPATVDESVAPIYKVDKPFRIKIGAAKDIPMPKNVDASEAKTFCSVGLYHHGELIWPLMKTKSVPYTTAPAWMAYVEGGAYSAIPWGAFLCFMVCVEAKKFGKNDVVIAWANYRIVDFKDRIAAGYGTLKLFLNSKPNPSFGFIENEEPGAPTLTFELGIVRPIPVYIEPSAYDLEHMPKPTVVPPTEQELEQLEVVIKTDPLYHPTKDQQLLLWKHRYYCQTNAKSTAKLLMSVPWQESECVYELYAMFLKWVPLEPSESLELLNSKFTDRVIRKFALRNLKRMPDSELQHFLLQLVQAIKHETNHDSPLVRFLLRRALTNRLQIGQPFFWQLKAGLQSGQGTNEENTEWAERFSLILEAFLRGCGDMRDDFINQHDMYTQLKTVAVSIKSVPQDKRREAVKQNLSGIQVPENGFPLPINPTMRGKSFALDKCKSMQSKTMPLWLVFDNWDAVGDNVFVIFKAGDDLRQDQLTLQMIRIMDKMWLSANIDLQTTHYKCISTGPDEGWIEVVTESLTVADIQKMYGGFSAAFSETAIADWLKKTHPSEWEYQAAVDSFLHSCAASCVATFLLGIGDRHNDNIMISQSGHLFHIDFGRFLGNVQMWNGIKRERAPFVFTPSFAYVIGPKDSTNFKRFVELCGNAYNVLRKNANIFINLFMMMVGTGLPELTREEDIDYLRDAFSLSMTDEQAATKFKDMIYESLDSKMTELNFAVHIMANPN